MDLNKSFKSLLKPEFILVFVLFVVSLILNLHVDRGNADWNGLGDPYDYLRQAKSSLFGLDLYFPHKIEGFYPRPFTIPFFYHFANDNPDTILTMQFCVHSLSVAFLALAVSQLVNRIGVKILLIISIFLLGSWWNILGWATLLISESISSSFLFLWIASFIFLLIKRNKSTLVIHLIITLFFSFTRDNWCYIIPLFYGLLILISILSREKIWKISTVCFCFSLLVFFAQQYSIKVGERDRLPVINNVLIRIIPNDEHYKWFVEHGMPQMDSVRPRFPKLDLTKDNDIMKIYTFYDSQKQHPEFFKWVKEKGEGTYVKFLLTHPAYTFFKEETPEQLDRIFAYTPQLIHAPRAYTKNTFDLFPIFNTWEWLIISIGGLVLYFRKKQLYLIIPCCLGVVFFLNIFLLYNADSMEDGRHFYMTNPTIQLLSFIGLALILDNINYSVLKQRLTPSNILKTMEEYT